MSILMMRKGGMTTGEVAAEFNGTQLEMPMPEVSGRAIYVKLTPGTELYNKVLMCAGHTQVTPTRAARMLIKAGWLSFSNSYVIHLKAVKDED
jgi:hypothetical protein